ncbi:hypothetical protein niasHS_002152 [Heterodera schachtii]|uniref:SAND domain-containing protein n=1 Tax=Heterodera schachtii TaxID=97005 RepID=A0ABD2KNE2_HETSC
MASSFLGKSPNSFTNIAHHHQLLQSSHHQNGGTEIEKGSPSPSSTALNSDHLLSNNNEAAMALSSLIEFGKNRQQTQRDEAENGIDNDDCRFDASAAVSSPSVISSTFAATPANCSAETFQSHANGTQNVTTIKTEDNESGDELPPQDDSASDAPVHEIRCGLLNARLHMQRFTCPGIHRKCVEFEGKLISPRQFTIKAEKDKQKDWKGSIRLGKHNLRTLMEMKRIDFYEHSTNCSQKCQSRNYIKNRKSEAVGGCGGGGESAMPFDALDEGKASNSGGFDFGDATELHSTTSSSSTRKSSAVLEDYVSQTIPNVNGPFVPLNLGNFCGGEEQTKNVDRNISDHGEEKSHQPSGAVSALCAAVRSSSHLLDNSPSVPTTSSAVAFPPFGSSSTNGGVVGLSAVSVAQTSLSFVPSFGLLQQQSPIKQLLYTSSQNRHNQLVTSALPSASPGGLMPSQQNGIKAAASAVGGGHSAGVIPAEMNTNNQQQQREENGNNTLALLLQSLQTSILLEQQQKAFLSNSGTTHNNLGTLLNRIPSLNGGSPVETALHRNGAVAAEQPVLGNNRQQQQQLTGIERLLNVAALVPQLHPFQQLQRTQQTKQEGNGGGGGANVRKVMEENSVLFWSQMRSMGLLDDLLNTLSTTLERLKHIYLNGGNAVSEEFAARRLSGVALALDLCTLFSDKIHNRCIQATLETNLITKELLELQRKQEEQKRKLESAKRKSQMFELLKNGNASGEGRSADSPPEMKKIHLNI